MSYSSRVYRQRNAHSNDEGAKEGFFIKKSEADSPEQDNAMFDSKLAVQRLSTPAEDEKIGTNDARMEKDKAIQAKPEEKDKNDDKNKTLKDPKKEKEKNKPGTDGQ